MSSTSSRCTSYNCQPSLWFAPETTLKLSQLNHLEGAQVALPPSERGNWCARMCVCRLKDQLAYRSTSPKQNIQEIKGSIEATLCSSLSEWHTKASTPSLDTGRTNRTTDIPTGVWPSIAGFPAGGRPLAMLTLALCWGFALVLKHPALVKVGRCKLTPG